jgi:hypothetical protein
VTFVDLIKEPLATQVEKLAEGKKNINAKIDNLVQIYNGYETIIKNIDNNTNLL